MPASSHKGWGAVSNTFLIIWVIQITVMTVLLASNSSSCSYLGGKSLSGGLLTEVAGAAGRGRGDGAEGKSGDFKDSHPYTVGCKAVATPCLDILSLSCAGSRQSWIRDHHVNVGLGIFSGPSAVYQSCNCFPILPQVWKLTVPSSGNQGQVSLTKLKKSRIWLHLTEHPRALSILLSIWE